MRSLRLVVVVVGLALAGLSAAPASADPPTTHEVIYTRPSGFWTSTRPAVGGAYRWRLLGVGVLLATVTGLGMLRLVRRANAERAAAAKAPANPAPVASATR
ncbi:MAG: hypothetical protein IPQ07_02340 [Myxococcales bacterium]|nr:hypothetical protein [Myxococcales bacterium]